MSEFGAIHKIGNAHILPQAPAYEITFDAIETGKGWDTIKEVCTNNAEFSSQAGPLLNIKTLEDYVAWMQGVVAAMPDCSYKIVSSGFDAKRNTAQVTAIFSGR